MKKLILKDGTVLKLSQEKVNSFYKNLENADKLVFWVIIDSDGNVDMIINVKEIVCIA